MGLWVKSLKHHLSAVACVYVCVHVCVYACVCMCVFVRGAARL